MGNLKIGIQLYSLADDMSKDIDFTLSQIKKIGYDGVEFAGFYDKTPYEIKQLLEKHGLEALTSHTGADSFLENPDKMLEYFKVLGLDYMVIPGINLDKEHYEESLIKIKRTIKILKESNIKLVYHNHSQEYVYDEEGNLIIEKLLKDTNGEMLVEVDIAWVRYAGFDVADYIDKNYKGMLPFLHVKDFKSDKHFLNGDSFKKGYYPSFEEASFQHCVLGEGVVDIKNATKSAINAGCRVLIVERDRCLDMEPLKSAELGLKYLKSLGL